ncbi:MAG: HAD hydrolase-like protein [Firmicutes bacterium]|nr:HAD hydrolase-like protein [Bacillota bacterium]
MNGTANRGKIIFDMDGVITGEDRYWDAAALTVWELLYSNRYLGLARRPGLLDFKTRVSSREIAALRRVIFAEDKVITFFKQRAVNSNWDLAALTFVNQLLSLCRVLKEWEQEDTALLFTALFKGEVSFTGFLRGLARSLKSMGRAWSPDFGSVLHTGITAARGEPLPAQFFARLPGGEGKPASRVLIAASALWIGVRDVFQEWYLGEERFRDVFKRAPGTPGKKGLIYAETPLLPAAKITAALRSLQAQGWTLGIATGRPFHELRHPLKAMGIWNFFEPAAIVTFNEVCKAEKALQEIQPGISLGKPHPFSFRRAYWGPRYSDRELVFSPPPAPPPGNCWAVGDSLADLLSAREMGALFAAVLTGPGGAAGSALFKQEGARTVLPDMTRLPAYLARYYAPGG